MEHIDSNTLWNLVLDASQVAEKELVEKHLSNCSDCKREFDLLKQMETTLNVLEEEVPPMGFSNSVVYKIEANATLERKSRFSTKFIKFSILGALALALVAAIIGSISLQFEWSNMEGTLFSTIVLIFSTCIILWSLFLIDRICNKFLGSSNNS